MISYKTFIFSQLKPFRWHMFGFAWIAIVWAVDTSLRPYLIKMIIDRVSTVNTDQIWTQVLSLAIVYVIASAVTLGFYRLWNIIRRNFIPRLKRNITADMMGHLFKQSHQYYQNNFAGSLANKINDVSYGLTEVIQIIFNEFMACFLGMTIAIAVLYTVRPMVALIFFIWLIVFLSGSWYFARNAHDLSDEASERRSEMTGKIVDIVGNMAVVRLFSRRKLEQRNVEHWATDAADAERRFDKQLNKLFAYQSVSFLLMNGIVLFYLIAARQHGQITVGDFALVFTLNASIVDSLWNMGRQFITFSEQLGKMTQGLKILLQTPEIQDSPQACPLKISRGEIEFKQVEFGYQKKPLFKNLSVKIAPGQKVGLVGYSGSGKTTFVNLIMRLFDIKAGAIAIDGQIIAKVTQESLRAEISFIPQDPTLFHRSILENIRYGRPDASSEEVIAAAKAAHAHEFIEKLPLGYHALVGERGIKLSGGQRQRIAIARAILKNAKIAILDEATSALDSITEQLIQDSLLKLAENGTTLVIAHRLSTLMQMDRILVFDRGRILEDGSHAELIARQGLYARLWQSQVNGFLADNGT